MNQMSLTECNERAKKLVYNLICTCGLRNGALIAKLAAKILKKQHETMKVKYKKEKK
jgi:hypothetical protein